MFPIEESREKTQMKKSWRNGRIWWARKHKIRKNQSSTELDSLKINRKKSSKIIQEKKQGSKKIKKQNRIQL